MARRVAGNSDQFRLFAGAVIGLVGTLAAFAVFKIAIDKITDPAQIVALASTVTTLIGTIVGAFVGVQVGSQGQQNLEAARQDAHELAMSLAARSGGTTGGGSPVP